MDRKTITNFKYGYLYNSKFSNLYRSQVLDNLFIQSYKPLLKRQKASFLSFPATKKMKQKKRNIIIDDMIRLNYLKENDTLIDEYLNYLIMKGIIVQQEQSSQNLVLFNKENKFTNNMIEEINSIEIVGIRRFFIPQIIAQIYIESDEITQNKITMNKIEKKESIEMFPLEKEPLKKQIINNIIVNGKSISDYNIEQINEIEIVCRRPHIILIDKGISLKVNAKEKPQLQEMSINSIFVQGNKIVSSKYFIQKNEEINILQTKKLIIIKQNLDTFLILGNIKAPNQICILEELFVQGKIKPDNEIQKIEEFDILQEKEQFYEIDYIISFIISDEDDEEDDINIILNENNIDINNIDNQNNTNSENTQPTKLRNKKYLKSVHKRKKIAPVYEMEAMERLFIERVYDMLLIERSWETLDIENENNFFIGELYNNSNYNNINDNIFKNANNNMNEITTLSNNLNNEVKINKSFEIICEKENEENQPENVANLGKNWNEVICPKFNNELKILGIKKTKLYNKKQKQNQNKILNEICFNIPRKENQHFLDKLKKTINNIDNGNGNSISNQRKWNDNNIIKEKVKNFTISKKKLKNKKVWDNPNRIQKEISFKIRSELHNINIVLKKYHTNTLPRNHNNIFGDEDEQFIDLSDYDYNSNKKEIFQDGKNKIRNRRENKRYSEDLEGSKENEFSLSRRNTNSFKNYKNIFKSRSNEKESIEAMRRQNSKRSSQKDFELLRENAFDQNIYD